MEVPLFLPRPRLPLPLVPLVVCVVVQPHVLECDVPVLSVSRRAGPLCESTGRRVRPVRGGSLGSWTVVEGCLGVGGGGVVADRVEQAVPQAPEPGPTEVRREEVESLVERGLVSGPPLLLSPPPAGRKGGRGQCPCTCLVFGDDPSVFVCWASCGWSRATPATRRPSPPSCHGGPPVSSDSSPVPARRDRCLRRLS